MEESKSVFASKTFWGAIVSGLSAIAGGTFGFEVAPAESEALAHAVVGIGAAIGIFLTLYGRWAARARIHA